MEPMLPHDRMRFFESLLKKDVEIRLDFAAMEKALFERINAADRLGPLAPLKAEQPAPAGFFDKVEADLFARIQNHREYEQPVNDIIAGPVKPSDMELRRIEGRLDDRIDDAVRLEPWEQFLKADVPLPMGRWEAVEAKLLTRVERHRKLEQVAPPSFWLGLGLSMSLYLRRPVAATSLAMGLVAAIAALIVGLRFARSPEAAIETLVYQAQGATLGGMDSTFAAGRPAIRTRADIRSRDDGAMILVNRRGFVEMRNGSNLRIEQANRGKLGYRVGFAGNGRADRGNVTFYVNKRKGLEKYNVATADYRIEVVGTYFRVQPDPGGRVSTSVLEGKVKIHSDAYGEFEVGAGQTLLYDAALGRYRVQDGGASLRREDIDTVPGMDELRRYGVLTLAPAFADEAGAEVRIDGKYKGATPMVVLLPPGRHTVRLSMEYRGAVDTSIVVPDGGSSRLSLALPPLRPSSIAVHKAPSGGKAPKRPAAAAKPETAEPRPEVSRAEESDLIYRKADEIQTREWQSAIELYRRVLDNPASKPLRREAALFSIAHLRADNEKEKTQAKEDFLGYLAQYPDGAFSGESWLRLAELEVGRDQGKAIRYYLRAIEKLPRHPRLSELQHRVGLLYLQDNHYDEAVAMFRQSLGNVLYANEAEKRKIYQSLYRAFVAKGDLKNADLIDEEYRTPE